MKLSITRPAARAAAFASVTARIFYALAVNGRVHNGIWIASILGAVLSIPMLVAVDRLRRRHTDIPAILLVTLCLASLLDSGLALSAVVRSSTFLATESIPAIGLMLPLMLTLYWCVSRNGDAVGYGAMLLCHILPVLFSLVTLLQARHFHPAWLLPILGGGWQDIWKDALRSAACFIPVLALPLLSENDPGVSARKSSSALGLSLGAALAAMLLLLRLMMAPTPAIGESWTVRLDTLLTNGRAPLYTQLPMIALWYGALMTAVTGESFAAALLLQRLFPALNGHLCVVIATVGASAVASSALPRWLPESAAALWVCPAITVIAALSVVLSKRTKGGRKSCES